MPPSDPPTLSPATDPVPARAGDSGVRGILWMLLTMVQFVSMDVLAKHLQQFMPVVEVVWARYLFHLVLLVVLFRHHLPAKMRTTRLSLQLGRSLLLLATTTLFFTGLGYIQIATAATMMYAAPLIVTSLSLPLLGERVGPRRWAGVVVGFAGALIILRPGTEAMQLAALLPMGAATLYALYQITTRLLSQSDPPSTTLIYTASVGVVVMSAAVPFFWVAPTPQQWGLMAVMGLLGGTGHFTLIKAFQAAPAATVTPFGYSSLIWATLFGFLAFGDLPDAWTVTGALVIVGSGLYIFHREQRRNTKI
ncbi:MAG: DMT family transporter [Hyphomicrobiales bacterium]|nr:DMT family transporter [Hyphomicrobiales bacterium]MCP5373822.1 DMT family transporter [Hyphomicrobiales bacterium]